MQDDLKEGIKLGITDIPAFFINNVRFEGEPTFKSLSADIQNVLKENRRNSKGVKTAA